MICRVIDCPADSATVGVFCSCHFSELRKSPEYRRTESTLPAPVRLTALADFVRRYDAEKRNAAVTS